MRRPKCPHDHLIFYEGNHECIGCHKKFNARVAKCSHDFQYVGKTVVDRPAYLCSKCYVKEAICHNCYKRYGRPAKGQEFCNKQCKQKWEHKNFGKSNRGPKALSDLIKF